MASTKATAGTAAGKRNTRNPKDHWLVFQNDQKTKPEMSDEDWKQITRGWRFTPEQEVPMKAGILLAIHAFIRLDGPYGDSGEYWTTLDQLYKKVGEAIRLTDKIERLNVQRLLNISPALELDPGFKPNVLSEPSLRAFSKVCFAFRQTLQTVMEQGKAGSVQHDETWLVSVLDRLIRIHVDPNGLPTGKKGRDFVDAVLKIAQRESGVTIKPGTRQAVIRRAKERTRSAPDRLT